jgi:ATP-dependent DNA helicase RecG
MVLSYVRQHGQIRRAEVMELCRLSEGQAKELLKRMLGQSLLKLEGTGRGAFYRMGERGMKWMESDDPHPFRGGIG